MSALDVCAIRNEAGLLGVMTPVVSEKLDVIADLSRKHGVTRCVSLDRGSPMISIRSEAMSTAWSSSRPNLPQTEPTATSGFWKTLRGCWDCPSIWLSQARFPIRTFARKSKGPGVRSVKPPEIRKYLFDMWQACELLAQFSCGKTLNDIAAMRSYAPRLSASSKSLAKP